MNLVPNATDENTAPAGSPTAGANETIIPGVRLEQLVDGLAQVLRATAPDSSDSPADPALAIRALAERVLVPALQTGLAAMAGDLRRNLLLWVENLRAIEHLAGLEDDLLVHLLQQAREPQRGQGVLQWLKQSEASDEPAELVPLFEIESTASEAEIEAAEDPPAPDRTEAAPLVVVRPPDETTPEMPARGQSREEPGAPPVARDQVRLLLRRAEARWRIGDQEGAVAACSKVIELAPQWAGGYFARGQLFQLRGQPTLARADFGQAIRLRPDHAVAWLRRGDTYLETAAWEQAAQDYSAALEANPRLIAAYLNRALVRTRQQAWAAAVKDASAALHFDPDCTGAYFIRGGAFFRLGEHARALADLSEVLQREPENFAAFNERGLVHAGLGDFPSALEDYQQALRLNPRFLRARLNRAIALSSSGQVDAALAALNQLIAAQPGQVVLYVRRGRVWLARKEPESALADFQRALAIQADCAEAAQGLAAAQALLDPEQAAFAELTVAEQPAETTANMPANVSAITGDAKTSPATDDQPAAAPKPPTEARGKSKQMTISLTCLNCQAASKIKIDQLGKRFQCPRCRHIFGVNAAGVLMHITPPRSRYQQVKAGIAEHGFRVAAAAILILALGGGTWFGWHRYGPRKSLPPLPTDLEARAELMAKAWYTGDTELVRRLTYASQGRRLKLWMRDHESPSAGKILSRAEKQQTQIQLQIRGEKRDTVRIEVKLTHPVLPAATLDLHWVRGEDSWFFQPFPEKERGGIVGGTR